MINDFDEETNKRLERALTSLREYANDDYDDPIIEAALEQLHNAIHEYLPEMRELHKKVKPEKYLGHLESYVKGIEDEIADLHREVRILYGYETEEDVEIAKKIREDGGKSGLELFYYIRLRNQKESLQEFANTVSERYRATKARKFLRKSRQTEKTEILDHEYDADIVAYIHRLRNFTIQFQREAEEIMGESTEIRIKYEDD